MNTKRQLRDLAARSFRVGKRYVRHAILNNSLIDDVFQTFIIPAVKTLLPAAVDTVGTAVFGGAYTKARDFVLHQLDHTPEDADDILRAEYEEKTRRREAKDWKLLLGKNQRKVGRKQVGRRK